MEEREGRYINPYTDYGFIPAISPYLRHGCMAGYPYHAPLGHSHLTRAYEMPHP
ncbi:MAG: hypothetical protein IJP74_12165 [Prevotella sp.]|nr:hypothetical protein [Prevotella sp.]